jgi:hypothetical protein
LFPGTILSASSATPNFAVSFNTGAAPFAASPSSKNATGQLAVPGHNRLNAQVFTIIAAGEVVGGSGAPSEVVEIAMYAQTSSQPSAPSYTKIATTGAVNLNATVDNVYQLWSFNVTLLGSNDSGIVQGYQTVMFDGIIEKSNAPLTNSLSGISFDANNAATLNSTGGPGTNVAPPFGLVMGVTFGSASAANTAYLYQFQLGQS